MQHILYLILGITVLVSFSAFSNAELLRKLDFDIRKIRHGEQYRMISSGFIHADIFHLFFNMFALYLFGQQFVAVTSPVFFLVIYFSGLLAGNLLTLYVYKNQFAYNALGASGAVSAIVFGSIVFAPQQEIMIFPIPIGIPAYIFGLVYLLYSMYGIKANNDNIGHTAHLGGALCGYIFSALIYFNAFAENIPYTLVPAVAFIALGIHQYTTKK